MKLLDHTILAFLLFNTVVHVSSAPVNPASASGHRASVSGRQDSDSHTIPSSVRVRQRKGIDPRPSAPFDNKYSINWPRVVNRFIADASPSPLPQDESEVNFDDFLVKDPLDDGPSKGGGLSPSKLAKVPAPQVPPGAINPHNPSPSTPTPPLANPSPDRTAAGPNSLAASGSLPESLTPKAQPELHCPSEPHTPSVAQATDTASRLGPHHDVKPTRKRKRDLKGDSEPEAHRMHLRKRTDHQRTPLLYLDKWRTPEPQR